VSHAIIVHRGRWPNKARGVDVARADVDLSHRDLRVPAHLDDAFWQAADDGSATTIWPRAGCRRRASAWSDTSCARAPRVTPAGDATIFRWFLLEHAHATARISSGWSSRRFGRGDLRSDGIGFELRLAKPRA
jgi:hypothetical protein